MTPTEKRKQLRAVTEKAIKDATVDYEGQRCFDLDAYLDLGGDRIADLCGFDQASERSRSAAWMALWLVSDGDEHLEHTYRGMPVLG